MSVAFSMDNRQIVSGSMDGSIKLWNTLAQCKYTIQVTSLKNSQLINNRAVCMVNSASDTEFFDNAFDRSKL